MKAVQVVFDEEVLSQLDQTEEVRTAGRSAVIRRITEEFLAERRNAAIAAAYQRGYADSKGLGEEWEGWENEAPWPTE